MAGNQMLSTRDPHHGTTRRKRRSNSRSEPTLHAQALDYLAKTLGGKTNQLVPKDAFRIGLHSYPDVIVPPEKPSQVHEVAEIKMTAVKLKEYTGTRIPTVLWLLTPTNLLDAFDEIRTLHLDEDRYWRSTSLWKNKRRRRLKRLDGLMLAAEAKANQT